MKGIINVLKENKIFVNCHIIYIKEIYTFALYPLFRISDKKLTCYDITYICDNLRIKVNFYNCFRFALYINNYDKLCDKIKWIIDDAQIMK